MTKTNKRKEYLELLDEFIGHYKMLRRVIDVMNKMDIATPISIELMMNKLEVHLSRKEDFELFPGIDFQEVGTFSDTHAQFAATYGGVEFFYLVPAKQALERENELLKKRIAELEEKTKTSKEAQNG